MNSVNQFEDSASRSRGKHEGESSNALCDSHRRTRDTSPKQLPMDHDHAVPIREYQTDQSSLKPAPAAAGPVLDQRQKQRQKQHHECAGVDRPLHIRACPITHFELNAEGTLNARFGLNVPDDSAGTLTATVVWIGDSFGGVLALRPSVDAVQFDILLRFDKQSTTFVLEDERYGTRLYREVGQSQPG